MNKNYLILFFMIIGMLSVPMQSIAEERESSEENESAIGKVLEIGAEAREMIELEAVRVQKKILGERLKVYGKIAKDTDRYSHVTFETEGVVEKVHVKLGDVVDEGTPLIGIKQSDGVLKVVVAPAQGTVVSIHVSESDKVDRLKALVSLVDVNILRSTFDIYEKDLSFVRVGQVVEVMSIAYPNNIFHGEVVFISPEVDEESKSVKVRVDVDNSEHLLKLGMSISGELIHQEEREGLIVPKSAIQMASEKKIVFVPRNDNEIEVREVHLGHSHHDEVEVIMGLNESENVVTQGSFYLKSELEKESFGGDDD